MSDNIESVKSRLGVVGWMENQTGEFVLLELHPENIGKNEAIDTSSYVPLESRMWEGISGGVKSDESLLHALLREAEQERGLRDGFQLRGFSKMPFQVRQNGIRKPTIFDIHAAPLMLQDVEISRLSETQRVLVVSPDYLLGERNKIFMRPLTEAVARYSNLLRA